MPTVWCVNNIPKIMMPKIRFDRLPMAERVGRGTPCLQWSLGVREVVGSDNIVKESFSSYMYQETGKVLSPEMPFYSKF